jgi:tetratricopeptide (TPR) repeat protein
MPEKALNQVPRALREQYQKGEAALQRQNYDYAIAILTQVLEQEPAFYDCRAALRVSQSKKSGAGTGFFKKMLSGASSSPLVAKAQISMNSNPQEALSIGEQILNNDANSSAGHKIVAEAAQLLEFPKTALLSLQILSRIHPKDEEIAQRLASVYADLGQAEKAEKIYLDLIRLHPDDPKLMEEYKNMSARKTLSEGGYEVIAEGKGSYRDILKDKEEAVSLEQENKQVKSEDATQRLIREYESRLEADPKNIKFLRTLAELYAQKEDYDRSLDYYNKIAALGSMDSILSKAIADTQIKKFDLLLSRVDPQAADYAEQTAQIKAQKDAFLLEECKSRAETYPNDLLIKFELGERYFQSGKITEAIQEFQKARANPHRHVQAQSYLGQCYARRNMNDLAARTFQAAIAEKPTFDDEKKELVYCLGCVLEKMGKKDEAIEQFKLIYETDIGYKDVAAKVDSYYGAQG